MIRQKNITIKIESLTAGLSGVGRLNNKTIFVDGVLPGEEVEITGINHKKNYCSARAAGIIVPSPFRVSPPCSLYNKCGGCNFMHTSYDGQILYKEQILRDLFHREFKSDLLDNLDFSVVKTRDSGYRNRARFHLLCLNENEKKYVPGFQMSKSNEIIPLQNCPCLHPVINKSLQNNELSKRINESLVLASNKVISDYVKNGLHVFGIGNEHSNENSENIWLESESQSVASVNLLGKNIEFDVRGFFQSNLSALEKLIRDNFDFSGDSFLDFYSGCGTFSVFMENRFNTGVLLEHNLNALSFAQKNLSKKQNIEFIGASDRGWCNFPQSKKKYDWVVIDPPRTGLTREVIKWFIETKQPKICFVSCNPVTLVRDLSFFIKNGGYNLEKGVLYDFYPQTGHMETLWILRHEN